MAASCALLSATGARGQQSLIDRTLKIADDWNIDSALAYYHEDGRIQAIEPIVSVNRALADGGSLNLTAVFDALSGASPNGALPSRNVQTFASPSGASLLTGRHVYKTAPGRLPVDPDYSDARFAFSGNWQHPITRLTSVDLGGKVSYEDDFVSVTANATVARDFNEKNTTLSAGVTNEFDSLRPIGGAPVPRSDYSLFAKTDGKTKNGMGILLGLAQVLTRVWLVELNASADRFRGYLNDPYKIMSVVSSDGTTTKYEYENRPEQRLRKSVYLESRVAWDQVSTSLTLRYMADDWHVRSDTAQVHVRWSLFDRQRYIEPSARWYRQTGANFYSPFLSPAAATGDGYASSDSRLGPFRAMTYGVKFAQQFPARVNHPPSELSVRLEYYAQTYQEHAAVPDALQGLDLYPGLKAVLCEVGWRF